MKGAALRIGRPTAAREIATAVATLVPPPTAARGMDGEGALS